MKNKIKEISYACIALLVLLLIPLFLAKKEPIEVSLPTLDLQEATLQEEARERAARQSAKKALLRKIFHCTQDENCIIVEQDPCGCGIGPAGVTAINIGYTLDFNRIYSKNITKACPEGPLSTEKECSPSAKAVCRGNVCKIEY